MTDFRAVESLEILRDGERVADLRRLPKGCEFCYTDAFLASGEREIALHLPKTPAPLIVEGVANLPTYFAGLLPEGVMFAAVRTLIGAAGDDLFAVLAATGADAIGDVEARVPGTVRRETALDLPDAADLVAALLAGHAPSDASVAAIPGVQPKLSLGEVVRASRREASIAKFAPAEYPGLLENEAAVMDLARRCRLDAAEVRLEGGALVVTRFDRTLDPASGRLRRLHLEDMVQILDRFPNAKYDLEYAELLGAMRGLGVSRAGLLGALRLYVFSWIVGNGDLHAKNVSLLRGENGAWRLSPAYDLLSTLPYATLPGADRMALALADEAFGRFGFEDFVSAGLAVGVPRSATEGMVARTARSVLRLSPLLEALGGPTVGIVAERARSLVAPTRD